ncbi:ImmA/IrrE family metallo-endopeptidase [Nocardioides sp. LHD-245]|uniref:ImmA/IrrE family metallo-endopeptidase n=1 Tax=Nocardioides sp. LHD-245 TaxID=3051387 RepID=UPI0027E17041|nr:ImmA/IrrE family metallo-endopeptidase [Nocardioides sp. LHD-245]
MTSTTATTPSVLASLRHLIPRRPLTFDEALRVAEQQAIRMAALVADERGILEHHITGLPRITVAYDELPVSGMSHWNGEHWVITIAKGDPVTRQRFTILHEYKHIIDHGRTHDLYTGDRFRSGEQQAEKAADYFAGCALVGKRELKAAWVSGIQKIADLASHFGVSEPAIQARLAQTRLNVAVDREPTPRCARPTTTAVGSGQRFRAIYTTRRA